MSSEFFDATTELTTINQWARARFAAPWAVLGAVLLRVAASTGPHVQLPGVIGGPASLNMIAAFVAPSGGGKGISDRVAREAWPTPIIERPVGSGEGIAALFVAPKKEGVERISRAIINISEIDSMAGIAARQGSILLAQLKATVMGELIGQSNASEATTRVVPAHSYRCCISIGAQPGHLNVIFADASGGTPQRLLWFPTVDAAMPATPSPDPAPLNTRLPSWASRIYDDPAVAVTMQYALPEIAETIIAAHIARQRGEADALDGHRMLTRCKVAAALALLHHRGVVSELDWQLSAEVMTVSDLTRAGVIEHARQAARAKVRDRAIGRATFDEIIEERHGTTVRNRILRLLANGSMPRGELRRAMGKQHYREAFDAVLPHLEKISQVMVVPGEKAPHYTLNLEFTGEQEFTPEKPSSDGVNQRFTGEPQATVTDIDSRRSPELHQPKLSAAKWLENHLIMLRADGHTTAESFAVYGAADADGVSKGSLKQAVAACDDIKVIGRKGNATTWSIVPGGIAEYVTGEGVISKFLGDAGLSPGDVIDKAELAAAAERAGVTWKAMLAAARKHPRIASTGQGNEWVWTVAAPDVDQRAVGTCD